MPDETPGTSGEPATPEEGGTGTQITPELVNEIADKVYAMLLLDLKIESERLRPSPFGMLSARGGW